MSPHHPRAPLRAVRCVNLHAGADPYSDRAAGLATQRAGDRYEAQLRAKLKANRCAALTQGTPVPMTIEALRERYPDRATNMATSIRLVNDTRSHAERVAMFWTLAEFYERSRRGWLSMLLVQLRGEA